MRKMKKFAALGLALTMIATMLTACGGSDKSGASNSTSGETTSEDSQAAQSENAQTEAEGEESAPAQASSGEQVTITNSLWEEIQSVV